MLICDLCEIVFAMINYDMCAALCVSVCVQVDCASVCRVVLNLVLPRALCGNRCAHLVKERIIVNKLMDFNLSMCAYKQVYIYLLHIIAYSNAADMSCVLNGIISIRILNNSFGILKYSLLIYSLRL